MLDRLANMEKLRLELRTKSVQIRALLRRAADPRVVVAFSLSPEAIVSAEEHGTPSLERRLDALQRLQAHGWLVGLRFDPVIASSDALRLYAEFFDQVFDALDMSAVHSATLGSFRLPRAFHNKLVRLYPDSRLLAAPMQSRGSRRCSSCARRSIGSRTHIARGTQALSRATDRRRGAQCRYR